MSITQEEIATNANRLAALQASRDQIKANLANVRSDIDQTVKRLTALRRDFAKQMRDKGKTYKEIGEALSVKSARARQIVQTAERLKPRHVNQRHPTRI